MGQGKSHGDHERSRSNSKLAKSEKKEISLENAIRPNGFLPPEIVFSIMNSVDIDTFRALAISCKLFYETSKTTNFGSYMQLAGANMVKGQWWAETLANRFTPRFNFSYVASFSGNKVLVNNHHINPTSYGNYKFWSGAHILDLTTMEKSDVTYGSVLAQDYILHCKNKTNEDYFEWSSFEVLDKKQKVLHKIERKNPVPPPEDAGYGYINHHELIRLLVNEKQGRNTILLWNFHVSTRGKESPSDVKITVEVYDLKSGKLITEKKIEALEVIGFYEDSIVVVHHNRVSLVDLNSNTETTLSSDTKLACHYVHNGRIAVRDKHKIKFFSMETRKEVHEIDLHTIEKQAKEFELIRALAFDNTKLIVTYDFNAHAVNLVLNVNSGSLITTLFAPDDRLSPYSIPKIYLAPIGKIVTDMNNLTAYDFVHPYALPDLSIPVSFMTETKIQQTTIKANALGKHALEKLKEPFDKIRMRTLSGIHNGDKVRVTLIFAMRRDYEWGAQGLGQHVIFSNFEAEETKRSAWQLTLNDVHQVAQCHFVTNAESYYEGDSGYMMAKEAVLVYERFNAKKKKWEFCEPCVDNNKIELVKTAS